MSRLECVRETLRLALEEVETTAGHWPRPEFWKPMWERYVESKLDYRAEASVLQEKMNQAGLEAGQLLEWVRGLENQEFILQGEQVQLLERVWN